MRITKYLLLAYLLLLVSCVENTKTEKIDFSTTDEFMESSYDKITYSKTRDRDLVTHLYKQALEKDPKLEHLDEQMRKIHSEVQDSLAEYKEYREYVNLYYQSAESHILSIRNSTKRKMLQSYFRKSEENFEQSAFEFSALDQVSTQLEMEVTDQRNIMKLIITENLVRSYQEAKPDMAPMKSINEKMRDLIEQSDKYTNQ